MEKIIDLHRRDMTCAQVLLMLVADEMEADVPAELIRAMDGLHTGLGGCGDVCGVLTGGACVLAAFAGGDGTNRRDSAMNGMIQDFCEWFDGYNEEFASNHCRDMLGEFKENKMTRCLSMIDDACAKCVDILDEFDVGFLNG